MERSILDKVVNGALMGKRKIGRPLRYNLRTKGAQGYVSKHLLKFILSQSWFNFFESLSYHDINLLIFLDGLSCCSTQETSSRSKSQTSWGLSTHTSLSWPTDSTLKNQGKSVSSTRLHLLIASYWSEK